MPSAIESANTNTPGSAMGGGAKKSAPSPRLSLSKWLKRGFARFVFKVAIVTCKNEFNKIVNDMALSIASRASVQLTRQRMHEARLTMCAIGVCLNRFGLRKIGTLYYCGSHAAAIMAREAISAANKAKSEGTPKQEENI